MSSSSKVVGEPGLCMSGCYVRYNQYNNCTGCSLQQYLNSNLQKTLPLVNFSNFQCNSRLFCCFLQESERKSELFRGGVPSSPTYWDQQQDLSAQEQAYRREMRMSRQKTCSRGICVQSDATRPRKQPLFTNFYVPFI